MKKLKSKKVISAVIAVVSLVALLLTGTFAYVLNNQHRSDYLGKDNAGLFDLSLINRFNSYDKTNWSLNESVQNEILVRSLPAQANDVYVDAYVAVQLKEYVDTMTRGGWIQTAGGEQALFAIDGEGDYMSYADTVAAGITDCVKYPADASDDDAYAIINNTQKAADDNAMLGIHGKPMRADQSTFTYGDQDALDAVKSQGASPVPNDECEATPIDGWDVVADDESARDYVAFDFGDVIAYADWLDLYIADPTNPDLLGEFWILGDDGWAYWAQALAPDSRTTNLIDSITLKSDVTEITYYLHVDMVAASFDEIDVLKTDAAIPDPLLDAFKKDVDPDALPGWAEEAGLTGTAEDVGKEFTADGIVWVVLSVDRYNNMLILSKNTLAQNVFNTDTTNCNYAGSQLEAKIAEIYSGLTSLQPYAMGANTPNEDMPPVGYISDASTYSSPEGLSSCTSSKDDARAFALSCSDINTLFTGSLASYKIPGGGPTQNWYGRSNLGSNRVVMVYGTGATVSGATNYAAFGVRPAMYIRINEPAPRTVPEWAEDIGLTGTSSDVGKIFEADGYEWIVLDVDDDGNMLIIAKDTKKQGKFNPDWTLAGANEYEGSQLQQLMVDEFDSLTFLKDYARGANTPTTAEEWMFGNIPSGQETTCTGSADDATAFALSVLDVETYFVGDLAQYRKTTLSGTACAWFTRTKAPSYPTMKNAAAVGTGGSFSSFAVNAPASTGLRPALYINIRV